MLESTIDEANEHESESEEIEVNDLKKMRNQLDKKDEEEDTTKNDYWKRCLHF